MTPNSTFGSQTINNGYESGAPPITSTIFNRNTYRKTNVTPATKFNPTPPLLFTAPSATAISVKINTATERLVPVSYTHLTLPTKRIV